MVDINTMIPASGRMLKENNQVVNTADILAAVYDTNNGVLKTSSVVNVSDLQIGAVEVKDSTTDNRLVVNANGSISSSIVGFGYHPSVAFTRPNDTTAYAVGDVVGTSPATNLAFANIVSAAGKDTIITGVCFRVDVAALPSGIGAFRLHLYNSAPTAIVDNAAYNLPSTDRAKYLGFLDIVVPNDIGDTLYSRVNNINMQIPTLTTTIYGILETRAVFTPTALCVKNISLHSLEV